MAVTGPTNNEQLMLELINDARLDPLRNADRYITSYPSLTSGNTDIQAAITLYQVYGPYLQLAFQALTPVGALAWNNALATSAETHSASMISAQTESTQVTGEAALATRLTTAGYTSATASGENVSAYASSVLSGHAGLMIDWGAVPDGMLDPAIHRATLMNGAYNEIGIDVTAETTTTNPLGPQVVTQDFGSRGKHFVVGVAYTDSDHNSFYSVGEGLATLVVKETVSNQITTGAAGGYTLEVTTGAKTFTLTGGGLASAVTVSATIGAVDNLKIDVIDGHILQTSGSVSVSGTAINTVRGLDARGQSLTTGTGAQTIIGTRGADTIDGGAGADAMKGGPATTPMSSTIRAM